MSRRSKARELVVQMLYQVDANADVPSSVIHEQIRERLLEDPEMFEFAWKLFSGTVEQRAGLDAKIESVATNWSISRMAITDRNVLRLGAYELMHTDVPPAVAINEAVELSKTFGAKDSPPFINGVLDKIGGRSKGQA
ncbi:MAG: transcription antitermination factor NusB [Planctomycetota bacterium]|nr:MAG: transcription antitermination factor NusB [Planctomycetota bacterium]